MACLYNWVKRNRRKLLVGGAAVGGLLLAGRVLERKMLKDQEEEAKQLMELARKQNHFQATENTCNISLRRMLLVLKASLCEVLDSTQLREELRGQPPTQRKLDLWQELKVLAFARNVAYVVGGVYLAIFLRLELSLLAGYLFADRVSHPVLLNNNSDTSGSGYSAAVQEQYLASCSHFASQGMREYCRVVLSAVKESVQHINLKQRLSLAELEGILMHTLSCLQFQGEASISLMAGAGRYLIPASGDLTASQLTAEADYDTLKLLFAETLDILDSEEVQFLSERLCRQGFSHTLDKLAEHYTEQGEEGAGFMSPALVSLPMAKLVPILSGLLTVEDEEEEWLTHLIDHHDLRTFGANVYESFCQAVAPAPDAGDNTWLGYISSSISGFF